MYPRRKWWEDIPVAPEEKGEQIDFKCLRMKKKKKKLVSGIWGRGRFIIKNFFALSYMGKHRLDFTVNEPFSFFSFSTTSIFQARALMHRAAFIMILSDCSRFIHWHHLTLSEAVNKSRPCVLWDRNCLFCSRFAFDTKSLHVLLKSGFGMSVQYK